MGKGFIDGERLFLVLNDVLFDGAKKFGVGDHDVIPKHQDELMRSIGDDGVPELGHTAKLGEDYGENLRMVGKEMQNLAPKRFVEGLLVFAIDGHNNFGFLIKLSNLGNERDEIVLKAVHKSGDADTKHWGVTPHW